MTAEPYVDSRLLTLICEPQRPASRQKRRGWRWKPFIYDMRGQQTPHRDHRGDEGGAAAQHALVRYMLGGETRREIAHSMCYSERVIQSYLSGKAYPAYTAPIFATFARLGIPTTRGTALSSPRWHAVMLAQRQVLRAALERPSDPKVLADMRLFTSVCDQWGQP